MTSIAAINRYLQKHGFERFEPKAVLFDMDGVLYDSMPHHAIAWQQSMATFGIHMTEADAYATEGARGIDTIRQMVKEQRGEDITLERAQEMYDEKTRVFHQLGVAPLMPGILGLMENIRRQGLQIGVVTGSGQRPLINRLTTDFEGFVDEHHIVTAYDVRRGKPHADPYLMGMVKAGADPWQTVVVENAPLGVMAGTAARALTIAVNTGPLNDSVLRQAGADLLFGRMTDLRDQWTRLFSHAVNARKTHDERWEQNFLELSHFISTHKAFPSKHRIEEHRLLNWMKYNRKLIAANKLSANRQQRFEMLLQSAADYHKLNQYSYISGKGTTKNSNDNELSLF